MQGDTYCCGAVIHRLDEWGRHGFWIVALLGLLAFALEARANGEFAWAAAMGGTGTDIGNDIAVDGAGNVYITGQFEGTADFDPGPGIFELTAAGEDDGFVCKLDANGDFVWARAIKGGGIVRGYSIALDGAGNVYTTGQFRETADFDPGPDTFELTAVGSGDIYVSKLDTNGNFVWARSVGGTDFDEGRGIAVDGAGNVYITGRFDNTVDFDPGPGSFELTAVDDQDMFVAKFDTNGGFIWARAMGGAGRDMGNGVVVDGTGHVYTTGRFVGTVDFDPGPDTVELTGAGSVDIFVSKLTPDGDFVWARAMGGTSVDNGHRITVDAAGNVYTTGLYRETADFDPGPESFHLTVAGDRDMFVSKLDTNGDFVWARSIGGTNLCSGTDIVVDPSGNVYTTGWFTGTVDFDPGPETFFLTGPDTISARLFVSKLDSNGNFVWVRSVDGDGYDDGLGITLDAMGNIYTVGSFFGEAEFNPGPGPFRVASAGAEDSYILKLREGGSSDASPAGLSGIIQDATTGGMLPCAAIELVDAAGERLVTVTDENGAYYFGPLPAGVYAPRIVAPGYTTLVPEAIELSLAEQRTIDFQLAPGPAGPVVAGQVTDEDTGEPLVGVLAELILDSEVIVDTVTCADGRYEAPLPSGQAGELLSIEMRFSLPNYNTEIVADEVDPAEGGTVNEALQKTVIGIAALTGSVSTQQAGESVPLQGARVILRGPINASTQADADGLFAFDALLDGSYTVSGSVAGFRRRSVQRTLVNGIGEVDFVLEPETSPGDINRDGVTNAVDVQLVINAALGSDIGDFNADINGDGAINAVDVQLGINAALGIEINP